MRWRRKADGKLDERVLRSTKTSQTTHLKSSEDKVGIQRQPDGPLYAPGCLGIVSDSLLRVDLERLEQVPDMLVLSSIKVGDLFPLSFLSAE
jgi:hypothetical protein